MPLNAIKNYVKEELPGIYEAGKFLRDRAEDFNENREQVFEGVQQQLNGKDSTQINEEVRPIGSEAVLNGQPVFWSGQNYGWQSKGSFDKLMDEGQFRMGGIAAQRIGNSITEAIPQEVKDFATEKITDVANAAVDFYQDQDYETQQRINVGLNIANGVVTLADQGLEFISEKTNTSRFITDELAMAALTGGGSAALRRATPALKQSAKTVVKAIDKLPTIDDILPPTPPAALATAGAAPSVQLNVSKGKANLNLTPQVMEFTIKDPEFLEPLDKLGVREGIANTPANIKAREMLDKSLDRLDKRRAKLDSDVASGRIKKGSSRYNQKNKKIREERYGEMSSFYNQLDQDPPAFKKTGEKHVDPTNIDAVAEQHHLAAKAQTEPFIEIMLEVGDPDDLVALHEYSRMLGVIMGNSKGNMLDTPGPIHRVAMAKTAKEKAGNIHSVFNAAGMEPNNAYVRNLLKDAKSADDVMRVFKKYANEYLIPQQNIAKKIVKNYLDDYSIKLTTSERNKFNKLVSELN